MSTHATPAPFPASRSVDDPCFCFGVIEGFFGRAWSWIAREQWAQFLAKIGGNLYVYAPKSDGALRRHWRVPFDSQHLAALDHCRQVYQQAGVGFGVGLTLLDVQQGLTPADLEALRVKIYQLNQLNLDLLAILFDDMRGDFPGLAATQLDLVNRVVHSSHAKRFAVCPTYYSEDPALERVFGQRPSGYWETLRSLDPDIDLFWTGPQVCSQSYSPAHLAEVNHRLGRPVLLWDNYPVNDAQRLVTRLFLNGIGQREARLRSGCRGQLMNPMNQPLLSRIAIATMARVHQHGIQTPPPNSHAEIQAIAAPQLAKLLIRDAKQFAESGLEGLSESERQSLIQDYSNCQDPMAQEVVDWLQGKYAFDPACLTE
ncbi:beta-N-acetylglucosaminidase domain-containing protein [Lyngbya confervoides]|uniref:Protein O-GlcNAcase n=1 Tax=Lyngbya confervoides BDU141951 TaxID=1574623 RepID=A0ABD4TA09_9CYAN|nr:beta-N-acetylglucosaminidase domain-containing protein [Lyngbya confervoides]MCM1985391.1 protein O-GlcNAcase [Lyngbya confervoides BDU141951]